MTEFNAGDLAKEITINVKILNYKSWIFRLWVSRLFFIVGAWIAGINLEIVEE